MKKTAGIAELKARLSHYLRRVQRGETLTVLDRKTPIARLVPYQNEQLPIRIRKPGPDAPPLSEFQWPRPVELDVDVVELLREDRRKR